MHRNRKKKDGVGENIVRGMRMQSHDTDGKGFGRKAAE
jgi:hypothetical protein